MTDTSEDPAAAPPEVRDSAAAPEAASAPAAPVDPGPSEPPRRSFHLLLGTVLLPYFAPVIAWAIAWAFAVFWRRRATGAEARGWARRILALAVVDTLVAVATIASLFAGGGLPRSVERLAVESRASAEDRPMIGVMLDERFGGPGARVQRVVAGGPAERAGVRAGDVLVRVAGEEIDGVDTLIRVVGAQEVGSPVRLEWRREGALHAAEAVPEWAARLPAPPPAQEPDGGACFAAPRTDTLAPFAAVLALLGALAVFARGARAGLGWTAVALAGALGGSVLAASGTCAFLGRASGANEVLTLWGSSLGLGAVAAVGLTRVRTGEPAAPAPMRWTSALGLSCWYTLTGGARLGILLAAVLRATSDGAVPADEVASLIRGVAGTHWLALLAVPIVVLAPVGEELAFRGLLQPALARRWGQGAAIAVTSILFAALHWHYGMKLPLVIFLGAVLGWARAASGGLRAPILLHMIVNGLSLLVLLRGGR